MTDFEKEFETVDKQFDLEWKEKNNIPEILYHYTDARGLLGILENKNIRLTHVNYVNDSSELRHAWEITTELIEKRIKAHDDNAALKIILNFLIDVGNPLEKYCEVFVASLCEKDDLLNQWRGYGSSDGAFSIGIKTNSQILQNLYKVEYSAEEQKKYIESLIDTWINLILKSAMTLPEEKTNISLSRLLKNKNFSKIMGFFYHKISKALIFFKNDAFKSEFEWRIRIEFFKEYQRMFYKQTKFREANGILVPYFELPLHNADSDSNIPLESITFALAKDSNLTKKSIELLLLKHGYATETIKIIQSKVPLRFK